MYYAKLKKSDSKGCILYDFIYTVFQKRKNYRDQRLPRAGGGGMGLTTKGHVVIFLDNGTIYILTMVVLT